MVYNLIIFGKYALGVHPYGSAGREGKSKRGGRGWMRGKCQVVLGVGGREECRSAETGAGGEIGRIEECHVVILFYTV